MNSKYTDIASTIQIIGNIYQDVSLLEKGNYTFSEDDFTNDFHKIMFGTMYNLHAMGVKQITLNAIEDYLQQRPSSYAVYKANKGKEWLEKISQNTQIAAFDYYYKRLKKMTLLRMYDKVGLDISWLYDPDNILDVKKKQRQEDWLDNTSIEDIVSTINKKIDEIKIKYADGFDNNSEQAGSGAIELLEELQKKPEFGYPLYGALNNTVTRGARLKKFYLRSAATGVGKSRSMVADACFIACNEIYDKDLGQWKENGTKEPTLFITTEQEKSEIQTMMIAFLSDVEEEHIITGSYQNGEWERVVHAAELLSKSPLYIQELSDFSMQDIENTLKKGIYEHNVRYLFFDYIHSSMKILSEISSKSKVAGLREDNILFLISVKLKDLANDYGVFIMSATQLNGSYTESDTPDQNLLRGSKAIADKIDLGEIMLNVTAADLEMLKSILQKKGLPVPDTKISVYKNRRGRYKGIYLWCVSRKGVCKIDPIFATNYNYELVDIQDIKINITTKIQSSAF